LDRLDTVVSIDTPERVRFRYRLAGPGLRGAALLIDWFIQAVLILVVWLLSVAVAAWLGEAAMGSLLVGLFAVTWFYAAIFELALSGRTPGKLVLRLRVVRLDGAPVRWVDVLLRNLLRAADGAPFPYGIGALVSMFDPMQRRIGDLVAGTMVVVEGSNELAGGLDVPPMTSAEADEVPPRVTLSREQRRAIEGLLRRAPRLGQERAHDLARPLADALVLSQNLPKATPLRTLELAWLRSVGRR